MLEMNWLRLTECLLRPQGFLLLLLPSLFIFGFYFLFSNEKGYGRILVLELNDSTNSSDHLEKYSEVVDGYLVWNSKCHMQSLNPYDASIVKFVKKENYEPCSSGPLLTSIIRKTNGSIFLTINKDIAEQYKDLSCCWAPITRPTIGHEIIVIDRGFDSRIRIGECQYFKASALLQGNIDTLQVTCKVPKKKAEAQKEKTSHEVIYENVHAVLNSERVSQRLNSSGIRMMRNNTTNTIERPLSVLILGIDSVSRLNFQRSMPFTRGFLEDRRWIELQGYNKMGDNTFPNLMAILTGQNATTAFDKCDPRVLYGLDNCSMIWYNFRDSSYVTAFAEDESSIGTFNYLKVGFVKPPTDYYLRPYALATERLLKSKKRFGSDYCTGPELSVDRIFDYGVQFAKTFIGVPYFGFFWTNSVSHNNVNGPSLYDMRFMSKLQDMESAGVMNDSMIILLSDHGMRFSEIRGTFVGWYEERLPFFYIWLPEWFRKQHPEALDALNVNQNRLTSPYDLYETLRDILNRAGGQAPPSTGCPGCQTLFKPVPYERGCKDAGITSHWCTCSVFKSVSSLDKIINEGAQKFVEHIDKIAEKYKSKKGNRLCAKLKLKKIIRVKKVLELDQDARSTSVLKLFYVIQTSPGDGIFEATIGYNSPNNYTIRNEEISRINIYYHSAKCLNEGSKQYCHCVKG